MPEIKSLFIECYCYVNSPNGLKYLLLKRNEENKIYPGIWQIITGRIENGEKAYEAALRELKEETGLEVKHFYVIPEITRFYTYKNDTVNLIPLFLAEVMEGEVIISDEHSEYLWCEIKDAVQKVYWESQKRNLKMIENFLSNKSLEDNLIKII